jgi:hypothetical protein
MRDACIIVLLSAFVLSGIGMCALFYLGAVF